MECEQVILQWSRSGYLIVSQAFILITCRSAKTLFLSLLPTFHASTGFDAKYHIWMSGEIGTCRRIVPRYCLSNFSLIIYLVVFRLVKQLCIEETIAKSYSNLSSAFISSQPPDCRTNVEHVGLIESTAATTWMCSEKIGRGCGSGRFKTGCVHGALIVPFGAPRHSKL